MDIKNRLFEAARQYFMYALSLPERTIRSLAALAGGTSTLLVEMILPESLRGTTTYNVTIGMLQQFVVERVAGMESEVSEEQADLKDDYVQRKMAGTALEAAGLLAMGVSPLWVFAIAGDAAGGSKLFLNRLVERLKVNGVVDEELEAIELVDVLEAVQEVSNRSAAAVDTPPLTREELSQLADEMKGNYAQVFNKTTDLVPRLDVIWESIEQLARQENISVERLGGIMTMDAVSWSKKGAGMVRATGQTGAELFDEKILDSYRKTLAAASEQGAEKYISDHMQPFMLSAKARFDPAQKTWTESKLEKKYPKK